MLDVAERRIGNQRDGERGILKFEPLTDPRSPAIFTSDYVRVIHKILGGDIRDATFGSYKQWEIFFGQGFSVTLSYHSGTERSEFHFAEKLNGREKDSTDLRGVSQVLINNEEGIVRVIQRTNERAIFVDLTNSGITHYGPFHLDSQEIPVVRGTATLIFR